MTTEAELVKFAVPFVKATMHVLKTMAAISPAPGTPYIKKTLIAQGDVSAIIGFTGDMAGSVSFSFTKRCAIGIVKNMLGDAIEDIMTDSRDAVGEISNMISGQARAGILLDMGVKIAGSTPSIIFGDNHTICHMTKAAIVAIPFDSPHGPFTIEICIERIA